MRWHCFWVARRVAIKQPLAHRPRIGWHHPRPKVRHIHAAWVALVCVAIPGGALVVWPPTWGWPPPLYDDGPGVAWRTAERVPVDVPEPGTAALLAAALVVLAGVRRDKSTETEKHDGGEHNG